MLKLCDSFYRTFFSVCRHFSWHEYTFLLEGGLHVHAKLGVAYRTHELVSDVILNVHFQLANLARFKRLAADRAGQTNVLSLLNRNGGRNPDWTTGVGKTKVFLIRFRCSGRRRSRRISSGGRISRSDSRLDQYIIYI